MKKQGRVVVVITVAFIATNITNSNHDNASKQSKLVINVRRFHINWRLLFCTILNTLEILRLI
jgi:hypothetical protein